MARLCVDCDGVLADNSDLSVPYADRKPYPHAIEWMKQLHADGHYIIILTARGMTKYDGDKALASKFGYEELYIWLTKYGIPFDELHFGKPSADAYIDDRAVQVNSNRGTIDWRNNLLPYLKELS